MNSFTGSFPPEINLLTGLIRLNISGNSFSGNFPNLTSLTALEYLDLSGYQGELAFDPYVFAAGLKTYVSPDGVVSETLSGSFGYAPSPNLFLLLAMLILFLKV